MARSRQDRSRDVVSFHGPRFHTIKDIAWKPLDHFTTSGESRAVTVVGWGGLLEAPETLSLQRAPGFSRSSESECDQTRRGVLFRSLRVREAPSDPTLG